MGLFWLLHLCIWLTMSIGLFSMVAILAWVVFVPGKIWDLLEGRKASSSATAPVVRDWGTSALANGIAALFLVYMTLQNVLFLFPENSTTNDQAAGRPLAVNAWVERFGRATMSIQQFRMFDVPPLYNPWYEYGATLMDGRQVELFGGQVAPLGQRPESVYDAMQNQYWRRLHWNLTTLPSQPPEKLEVYRQIRQQLLLRIVQQWNEQHPDNPVAKAWLRCYLEPIVLPGDQPAETNAPPILWASYQLSADDSP